MKAKIVVIALLAFISPLYAIDGTWTFRNALHQNISSGKATLQTMEANVISQIEFSGTIVNSSFGSKRAKVYLLMPDNSYKQCRAEYKESSSLIMLWIDKGSEEIALWLFISQTGQDSYWYSYAISGDAVKQGIVKGTKEGDSGIHEYAWANEKEIANNHSQRYSKPAPNRVVERCAARSRGSAFRYAASQPLRFRHIFARRCSRKRRQQQTLAASFSQCRNIEQNTEFKTKNINQ